EREWRKMVEPALPKVRERLWANLLLAAIWDNVLDERARRMLFRMSLLRRRWDWALMRHLGEASEPPEAPEAAAAELARTSLVLREESREGDAFFSLHPATAEFVRVRFGEEEGLRQETHLRVGTHLEAEAPRSRWIETDLEGGYHLFQAGEVDRSYELLG